MLESLYVLATQKKQEKENKREEKAKELAVLLDEHPETPIVYDWYSGIDAEVDREYTQYIIVSRWEIKELVLDDYHSIIPEPSYFYGYHRYDVWIPELKIREIKTKGKNFQIRRP